MKKLFQFFIMFLGIMAVYICIACNNVFEQTKLELTIDETEVILRLEDTSSYEFKYSTNITAKIEISCDKSSGYSLNDDVVTFTMADVYLFTIKASSESESVSENVKITVTEHVLSFELLANEYQYNLQNDELFVPDFKVSPKESSISFECIDESVLFHDEGIEFTKNGTYTISVIATYGNQKETLSFTVVVYDTIKLSGSGTLDDPWLVSNASDLVLMSYIILNEDEYFTDRYFLQTADISLSEYQNWTPIGTIGLPFDGCYDGNSYKVTDLYINSQESFQGLFGFVTGVIKNLTVDGEVKVSLPNMPYSHSFVGGICGGMNNGALIINCTNYANITGDSYVGGIVGEVLETDYFLYRETFSKVINCTNYGKITGNSANAINEKAMYFGGIAGRSDGIIEGCINYGEVDTNTLSTNGEDKYIGGIVGYVYYPYKSGSGPNDFTRYTAVKDCINYGFVHGTYGVGGIAGQQILDIENCVNEGNVVGNNSTGGIAGISGTSGTAKIDNLTLIQNCTNNGIISSTNHNAGGIVGYSYCDIYNSVNNGEIKSATGCEAYYLGGIVGQIVKSSLVSNCTNNGKINSYKESGGLVGLLGNGCSITDCTNKAEVNGNQRIGGIVGYASSLTIIKNCVNEASISGNKTVGGIVAYAYAQDALSLVTVVNSQNAANITSEGDYAGGIVGYGQYIYVASSQNTGVIKANQRAGGIVGAISKASTITACYNEGNISSTTKTSGGIVGIAEGGSTKADYFLITLSENKGVVGCDATTGQVYVGGIVGYCKYGTVSSNINYAGIIVLGDATSAGYIYGAKTSTATISKNENLYVEGA